MNRLLSRGTIILVFIRLGLLQASWNFQRLQNLGVLYALGPALRRLFEGEDLKAAQQRHLEYFNSHPYMAPAILGAALAIEETQAAGGTSVVKAAEFKKMTIAPFAAMGDALFWGGIRPLAACTALFFAFRESLWAPLVFLLLFNIPHLLFTIVGFWLGYRRKHHILEFIAQKRLPDVAVRAKEMMVVLLGALCSLLVFTLLSGLQKSPLWAGLSLFFVFAAGWLFRKGASALCLLLIGAFLCILSGYLL